MITTTARTANKITMLKKNQKIHNANKGDLKNKRKLRKKREQNETKIEIEINQNQINNTNYDVQSYNDNEVTNRKIINDKKAFNENQDNDEEKEKKDDSGEETDSKLPDLDQHFKDQGSDSDSDSDRDNNNDGEQKQRNQDHMKVNSGFLNGTKGIFNDKNNNQKKTRKMGKTLLD